MGMVSTKELAAKLEYIWGENEDRQKIYTILGIIKNNLEGAVQELGDFLHRKNYICCINNIEMKVEVPKKIFIVDDDEMLTMAMSDYLTRDTAHDISVYHTGEEAVKHLGDNPDIVILDFYLNTVEKDAADGLEVLSVMRKHLPNTRFIMLSSQESYAKAAQTIQKGAEQYVIKGEDAFEKIAEMI